MCQLSFQSSSSFFFNHIFTAQGYHCRAVRGFYHIFITSASCLLNFLYPQQSCMQEKKGCGLISNYKVDFVELNNHRTFCAASFSHFGTELVRGKFDRNI